MKDKEIFNDILRICDTKMDYLRGSNNDAVNKDGSIANREAYSAGMARVILGLYDFKIDDTMPTAYATIQKGGKGLIGVNSEFWTKCSDREKWQLLMHENGHLQYMHFTRNKSIAGLHAQAWNYATDCAINQYLDLSDTDTIGGVKPILPLSLSEKIGDTVLPWMDAEYYYEKIMQNPPPEKKKGGGGGEGAEGEVLDEHREPENDISEIDIEIFEERQKGIYSQNGLFSVLPQHVNGGVNWRALLARLVQKAIRHDSRKTANRPHRKLNNFTLPKTVRSKKAKIAIAVDTSGSMIADLPKVCAEIVKLISLHGVDTEFYGMDTELYCLGVLNKRNVSQAVEKLQGGGGTVFVDALPLLGKVSHNTPTILITDCGVDWPEKRVSFPLVVIGPENGVSPYPTIQAPALFA
jgi:predicted metal-dependent peptidase